MMCGASRRHSQPQNHYDLGTTVYRYPSLRLGDVYASIAFYLNHQEDVEAYLKQRQQQAQEIRQRNEARFDPQGLRDRLRARRVEQQG